MNSERKRNSIGIDIKQSQTCRQIANSSQRKNKTRNGKIQFICSGQSKTFRKIKTYRYNKFQAKNKLRQIAAKLLKFYTEQQLVDWIIKKQLSKEKYPQRKKVTLFVKQTFAQGIKTSENTIINSMNSSCRTFKGNYIQYIVNVFDLIEYLQNLYLTKYSKQLNRCLLDIQQNQTKIKDKMNHPSDILIFNRIQKSPYIKQKTKICDQLRRFSSQFGEFKQLSRLDSKIDERIVQADRKIKCKKLDDDLIWKIIKSDKHRY